MTDTMTELLDVVVAPPAPHRHDFNWATRALNINRDRGRFHDWLGRNRIDPGGEYTEDEWWAHYHHFVQCEDERDLANTQACALM